MPRKEKADKHKYEGKAYLDYMEACDYLGIKRATLYHYLSALEIKTEKFKLERKRYIAIGDVKKIEDVMEHPWLAGRDEGDAIQKPEEAEEAA